MRHYFLSSIRIGLRARSFFAVLSFGILLVAVSFLAGSFSPRQPQTVALDVGFSVLRFALVLFSVFWVQELVGKDIERKAIIFSLSYPVSRGTYLVGRFFGVQFLSLLATLLLGLLLLISVLVVGQGYDQQFPVILSVPFWMGLAGLWVDVMVVTGFTILMASVSTSSLFPLAMGAAFAVAGRAYGPIQDYVAQGADGDAKIVANFSPVLEALGYVLPDLSRLDWRTWSMYGTAPDAMAIAWSITMAVGFASISMILAILVFSRRQFA